jgi:hypothetical protein
VADVVKQRTEADEHPLLVGQGGRKPVATLSHFRSVLRDSGNHTLYDLNCAKNMLNPLMGRSAKYKVRLPELINARETLKRRMVYDKNLFLEEPAETCNRQKHLLPVGIGLGMLIKSFMKLVWTGATRMNVLGHDTLLWASYQSGPACLMPPRLT